MKDSSKIWIVLVFCLIVIIVVLLIPSKNKIDNIKIYETLKSLSEFSSLEFEAKKVISVQQRGLAIMRIFGEWSKRSILFESSANVEIGVDFSKIKLSNISSINNNLKITLPKAKIIVFKMNPDQIKLVFTKTGLLRANFNSTEIENVLKLGEKSIRESITANKELFLKAEKNVNDYLTILLKTFGIRNFNIEFSKDII